MLEVQLAVSGTACVGTRPVVSRIFPTGCFADEWDRWYGVMGPALGPSRELLYQYYYSSGRLHDSVVLRNPVRRFRQAGWRLSDRQATGSMVSSPRTADHEGFLRRLRSSPGKMPAAEYRYRFHGNRFVEIQTRTVGRSRFSISGLRRNRGNFIDQAGLLERPQRCLGTGGKLIRLRSSQAAKLYAFQFPPD